MRKNCITWLIPAMAIALSGCENKVGTGAENIAEGGNIQFEYGIVERVESSRTGTKTLPASVIPDLNDISLTISDGEETTLYYTTMSRYDKPMLKEGPYTAQFYWGDIDDEGESKACFAGEKEFTIISRSTITESVNLTLSNSLVSVTTTEWFRKYYPEYTLILRTESGLERKYTGTTTNPLTETDALFVKPASKIYLRGNAVKTNGIEVEFPTTEICTTKTRTWHEIDIDAGEVADGAIKVQLDDKIVKISEKEIELNPES